MKVLVHLFFAPFCIFLGAVVVCLVAALALFAIFVISKVPVSALIVFLLWKVFTRLNAILVALLARR